MLLIDGVRYELWKPEGPQAENEFEKLFKEHAQEIFGEQSLYFDIKQRLETELGIHTIPDGFVVSYGEPPQWRIIEAELSWHPLYDHIVNQIGRFISAIENTMTQRKIINAMDGELANNDFLRMKLKKAIGTTEVYRFLSDLISQKPILTIIIEKETPELKKALGILSYPSIDVVEFQTFAREGVGLAVHAHLFEPLYKPVILEPPPPPEPPPENSFEISLAPSYIASYCIYIPVAKKHLFPAFNTTLELDTDVGSIETGFNIDSWGIWLSKGLAPWFKRHPQLESGDKLIITVIEPMKKYRLEIVKQ